jgi:amino acid permease
VFDGIPVLDSLYTWLGVFFVSGSVFSFRNVSQTKVLQVVIIAVRFLSIMSMIVGAIYIIIKYGSQGLVPEGSSFNFTFFPELFSNTIFGLLCHHSIPSIVATVQPVQDVKKSVRYGFISSVLTVIIIPVTAIMAFGSKLSESKAGDLKYYNFDFKEQASPVYYLVSFYVFLNVAAVPVLTIVLRNNILKLVAPTVNSKVFSSN